MREEEQRMKHGRFIVFCLILAVALAAVPVFAEEKSYILQSRILDSFDDDSSGDIVMGSVQWTVAGSKWRTQPTEYYPNLEEFPKLAYVDAYPKAAFRNGGPDGKALNQLKSLGIQGSFTRYGHNWIDIYPVAKDDTQSAPVEIPLPGAPEYVDLWVWGSNLHYKLEIYIRDIKGVVHAVSMGSLYFRGWQNMRTKIPAGIPVLSNVFPKFRAETPDGKPVGFIRPATPEAKGLSTFVKFRIWTEPNERIDKFFIYLDQLKVLTNIYEDVFDGDDLAEQAKTIELWSDTANQQG
jgi:hypothetical protein